jgi:catechol 2,3-dioxygenase-like lactoylglutathione lyase family enzyme
MDSMSSPTELKSITPILFVTDVPTSAAYFRDKLGFAIDFLHGEPPFYGAVSRDGVCIHFRCVRQPNFAELAAREHSLILASIEVADVHAFFAELQGRGADIVQPPTKQTWGGTDLYVRDPDGNVISFVTFGL